MTTEGYIVNSCGEDKGFLVGSGDKRAESRDTLAVTADAFAGAILRAFSTAAFRILRVSV